MSSQKSGKFSGLAAAPDATRIVAFLSRFHAGRKVGAEVEAATAGRAASLDREIDALVARRRALGIDSVFSSASAPAFPSPGDSA